MASTSGSSNTTPTSDNAKAVCSNIVAIAAGAGVPQTITPVVPQQGATINNQSNNWVRIGWTFTAGITAGGAAANRVTLIPPNYTQVVDFNSAAGGNAVGAIDAVTSVTVIATLTPAATAESGTVGAATAATVGLVVINWLSA